MIFEMFVVIGFLEGSIVIDFEVHGGDMRFIDGEHGFILAFMFLLPVEVYH